MIDNRYFNIFVENPFKTWWKARKYFKLPKIRIHKIGKLFHKTVHTQYGDYVDDGLSYCPYGCLDRLGSILSIYSSDIIWKDKWNTPRHERSPIIWLLLFKRIGFCITFSNEYLGECGEVENGDTYYWEFLLNYIYYKHDLKLALLMSGPWTRSSKLWNHVISHGSTEDGSEDTREPYPIIIPVQLISLNKKGLKKLREDDK